MKQILIIDDEASIRTILKLILERAGYKVECAESARQGIAKFKAGAFDLVITDIIMPEQDGISTIMTLKKLIPEIPIMAISGGTPQGNVDFLETAKKVGAVSTIEKPFEPEKLLAKVTQAIH